MVLTVFEAASQLEKKGLLVRAKYDQSEKIISHLNDLMGQNVPDDLADFYRARIQKVNFFRALVPSWNPYVGWTMPQDEIELLKPHDAMPLFYDGCGSIYGLDLTPGLSTPSVYLFDHESADGGPTHAAGSSLARFLLLLAIQERAFEEGWPVRWELQIDPDLGSCSRAPPHWAVD